ncbi:putative sodium/hydrogen exchanger 9-like [Scophthalmus maximus]|uniref:Putative sodium/hydrogen exchanger 9-like n=1 Tax=Scophthalmus maximus TaxID=52904 RepID=A0A2U9D198_SCOMX|nr:putative sodium/hydrogen exchanger 9-like [Scophthalmus maximus]
MHIPRQGPCVPMKQPTRLPLASAESPHFYSVPLPSALLSKDTRGKVGSAPQQGVGVDPDPDEDLSFEDEEQLHGTEPDDSNFNLEKTENQLVSIGGDTGCEHQEDLVEGDLGLGTAPAPTREA